MSVLLSQKHFVPTLHDPCNRIHVTSQPFYTHVQAVKGFANIAVRSFVELEQVEVVKAKIVWVFERN